MMRYQTKLKGRIFMKRKNMRNMREAFLNAEKKMGQSVRP